MAQFNRTHSTFKDWSKHQTSKSPYLRRITKLHELFPKLSLTELNKLKKSDIDQKMNSKIPKRINFDILTESEHRHYKAGLDTLAKARKDNTTFDYTFNRLKSENKAYKNLQKSKVERLMQAAIDDKGFVKENDNIERMMMFFDKNGRKPIIVRGNKKATLISNYYYALKKYRDTGDYSYLLEFKGKYIVDIRGNKRYFITDKKLLNSFIEYGETDFYDLYVD